MESKEPKDILGVCKAVLKLIKAGYVEPDTQNEKYEALFDCLDGGGLVGLMDPANVGMLYFSSKDTAVLAASVVGVDRFFKPESSELMNVPELDYFGDGKVPNISKYSCEYLKVWLELSKSCDFMTVETKNDYPLRVHSDELGMGMILAPRVERD